MEFQWMSEFPSKKRNWYWEFELFPHVSIVNNPDQGWAVGIGWLFWTAAIFVDLEPSGPI